MWSKISAGLAALSMLAGVAPAFASPSPASPAPELNAPAFRAPRSAVYEITDGARAYKIYVAAPPGYNRRENADRAYPVIYLNDGDLFFQAASGAPLLSYFNETLEEVIVVGVSYAQDEDPIASRQRDLTPVIDRDFENATGGAARYLALFADEIIPLIEREYRADPARRTLAGHSLGAVFGLYAMFAQPSPFANYILVSPSLWYADYALGDFENDYAKSHGDLPARLYLAVGDLEGPNGGLVNFDMVNDEIAFAARLRARNYESLRLKQETLEGVDHAAAFPAAFLRALEWLYPAR